MAKKENRHAELVSASANIEAPCELPEGWKWIPLLKSFENKTSSNKKLPTKDYSDAGKYAIIDQGQEFIGGYSDKTDFVFDGELPIIIFGDHTKCIKYIDFPFIQGADGVKILKPISIVDSKYFYYALQNIHFPDLGYRRHFPIFKDYQFPLPPTLTEQERIVNRIETMFAKLDQAQEKVQTVLDSFETRKAAILHKAFTGELTANWRKANGVPDDSWEEKSLEKIADVGSSKRVFTTEFTESGIPFYRGTEIGALAEKKSIKNELFISEMHYEELIKCSGKPEIGDLLLPSICPDGRIWNVDRNEPFYFKDGRVLWIHFQNKDNDSLYIKSYLINEFTQNYLKYASGSTFAELKIFALKSIIIKLPSLPEQQEIVRILDTVLEKESRAKEAAQTVLDQIALLKKSILARAFRGEL